MLLPVKGAMHRCAARPLTGISPNDEDDQAEISSRVQISATDNKENDLTVSGRSQETKRFEPTAAFLCAHVKP